MARSTFGPVVLLGLAASGFAALAGHKAMLEVPQDRLEELQLTALSGQGVNEVEFPLAGALALVALACWGVLLVTRGVVRRGVAALALLAAIGVLVVLVVGGFVQADDAADDIRARLGAQVVVDLDLARTTWFWVALGCAVLTVVASVAATLLVPAWPEMGSRYDAPTGAPAPAEDTAGAAEEQSSLDLWKSLDEGTDPTDRPSP